MQTFGVTEEAYPADTHYLNGPNGLFIDGSDNLFVAEEAGSRLLKYQLSNKANLLSIGKAGLQNRDTYTFDHPRDIAVDSGGNIWAVDNHRAVEYNPTGTFIQEFPAADPWNSGSDNSHFNEPFSIAFDSAGSMYIADRYNHRVQVYDMSGPTPVYSTTIGETGVSGTDNAHFNEPVHLAFDGVGRLYVLDKNNYRVQRCVYTSAWSCSLFFGETGLPGTDTSHLSQLWVSGLTIKDSDLYIADTGNNRVLKCNLSGACGAFVGVLGEWGSDSSHLSNPGDVAVDLAGNVYVSDYSNSRIQKFTSSGGVAVDTLGTTQVPYVPDASRYNTPSGVAVGSDGSLIMTEYLGYRVAKLNAAGVQQWTVGQAGVWMWNADNTHFGDLWDGPTAVAVTNNGLIYVADTGSHRVQKCTVTGACNAFVGDSGNAGSDNTHFDRPAGVAVDASGKVYVGDQNNHRIQKCTAAGVCTTFAGVTGVSGTNNTHFSGPMGVTVDSSGNVYVADAWNNRVQKCSAGGSCSTFAGVTGEWGDDFAHFSEPRDVAVDVQGRVYVADIYNQRVQIFDSSGAYLTTIGGNWGSHSGELREPAGVDVDSQGNVYVTDSRNGRIQKFAPGVPDWQQKNINGFGDRNNYTVDRMSVFNGYLFAGTGNDSTGGEVWRSANGSNWSQVNLDGFGDATNTKLYVGETFNGNLYVGTGNSANGGEIWRCSICDGTDWSRVVSGGFGDSNNDTVDRVVVFSNTLYATTDNYSAGGVKVWKSSTGNSGTWTQANTDGFGNTKNTGLWAVEVFNDYLYVATAQWGMPWDTGTHTGTEVWRTNNGTTWSQVNTDGFGDRDNMSPWLESINGYLYLQSFNVGTGNQIWRCATCDGTDWTQVVSDGFGDSNNIGGSFMLSFGGLFYAGTYNDITGAELWQTTNGTSWSQVSVDGFGDSNNNDLRGGVIFNDRLFFATLNNANGVEVWRYNFDHGASNAPSVPSLVSPANNALTSDYTPTLDWSNSTLPAGTDFDHYQLQVSIDSGFTDPTALDEDISGRTNSSFTPLSDLSSNTKFFWRVRAYNTDGQYSNWSLVYTFRAAMLPPTLVTPLDAEVLKNKRPTFVWNPVTGATSYKVEVSTSASFATKAINATAFVASYTPTADLAANKLYYWRIKANGPNGPSLYSDVRTLSTGTPPSVPTLLAPADNALIKELTPLLDWSQSSGAAFDHYQIQLADNSDFTGAVDVDIAGVSNHAYTPTVDLIPDTKYYWHVRSWNTGGDYSAWSAVRTFREAMLPPGLIAPIGGATVGSRKPVLDWDDVTDATNYKLQVSLNSSFTSLVLNLNVTDSTYTPVVNLAANKLFYWRVKALGPNGPSAWSVVETFHTP